MSLQANLNDYISKCAKDVMNTDFSLLSLISEKLIETKKVGSRIFTAGNGGSSATASHLVNDLVKGCRVDDKPGFNAMCLSDSSCVVTCLANDFDYSDIYKIQLETFAKSGDLLIVYSGSGNSQNIIKACKYAKDNGIFVIGFSGRDGGEMKQFCDICLIAPTDSMEMLEDMHLMYEHALVSVIREELIG